jgi:ABC-type branched-subunit amino acid transport system substrate-binding protein
MAQSHHILNYRMIFGGGFIGTRQALSKQALSLFIILFIIGSCAPHNPPPQKVVLLAPFEGRYSEIGYSALYPARLAFANHNPTHIELLAVDDGGTLEIAVQRAQAIARDPQISIVITQGYYGTSPDVLAHLSDKMVIIVGEWGTTSAPDVYHLSHPALREIVTDIHHPITEPISSDFIGGETFGMPSFVNLQPHFETLTFMSSGRLPNAEFEASILASAPHATAPNHLSMLTYDAFSMAIEALNQNAHLSEIVYQGISGQITFSDGYWTEAQIYQYGFNPDGTIYAITP